MNFRTNGLLVLALLASAWSYQTFGSGGASAPPAAATPTAWDKAESAEETVKLTLWANGNVLEQEIKEYEKTHPNISVTVTNMSGERQLADRYLEALAGDNPPDMLMFTHRMMGSFNSIKGLEDLTDSPIPFASKREALGEYLWNIHHTLDGNHIFAVPFEFHTNVMYYRADLMEKAGLPSEPEAISAYLHQPGGWRKASEALKSQGVSTVQWMNDPINALANGSFVFGRSLDYRRDAPGFREAFEDSLASEDTAAYASMWTGTGQQLLRESKLAVLFLPDYGESVLASMLPEQSGLWRAAPLPFGVGMDLDSSRSIGIAAASKHKADAARFLSSILYTSGSLNWQKGASANAFLGGQKSNELYLRLIRSQQAETIPTPMDQRAFQLWIASQEASLSIGVDTGKALDDAKTRILDSLSVPQRQLQHYMDDNHAPK